jgi:hypothetical protein
LQNAKRVWAALASFGAPVSRLKQEDFATPDIIYQIGVAPRRIDILTVSGVTFDEAWQNRSTVSLDGMMLPVLGRAEMIRNKRASGRTKDLADVEAMESEKA